MSDSLDAAPEHAAPDHERDRGRPAIWAALIVLAIAGAALFGWQAERIGSLRRDLEALRAAPPPTPALPADAAQAISALRADVDRLQTQVAALGKRPVEAPKPTAPDLAPALAALTQRVAKLETMPPRAPAAPATAAAPAPLAATPIPAAPPPDLGPLKAELDQLREQVAKLPPQPDLSPIAKRLDALDGKLSAVQAAAQSADTKAQSADSAAQMAARQAQEAQSTAQDAQGKAQDAQTTSQSADGTAAQAARQAERASRAAQWQRAAQALLAGQKLGSLPGAPPALARFATEAPPTEASLRLSFPAAAAAARQASRPDAHAGFGARALQRVESLVTVREGDRVLVGAPAAPILEAARQKLDAGDLAGAVRALDGLDAAAAAAMSGWRGQAQALLDARAALDAASG
jgi:hypothetical protein